jgi:hypothetical protein
MIKRARWISLFLFVGLCITLKSFGSGKIETIGYPEYHVLGFSSDGNYFSFQECIQGWDYLKGRNRTYFIDVLKNSYAKPPFEKDLGRMSWNSAATYCDMYGGSIDKEQTVLDALNIKRVPTTSRNEANRVKLEPVKQEKTVGGEWVWSLNGSTFSFLSGALEKTYSIHISAIDSREGECPDAKRLHLWLVDESAKVLTLQKDERLPKSRGCPIGYDLDSVFAYGDSIAAIVRVFKKDETRFIAVTGKLR